MATRVNIYKSNYRTSPVEWIVPTAVALTVLSLAIYGVICLIS